MTGAIVPASGDRVLEGLGPQHLQLAAEASRAAILDAGLTPADVDGMVTFTVDGNDELELMRNLGVAEITLVVAHARRRRAAPARPCSTPSPRSTPGRRTPCSCTARSTSGRGTASASRTPGPMGPAPLDWYPTFGIDTPAKMYALWFRRYMHEYGVTNEDFGRYTVVGASLRGHQPQGVVLRAADHARGPPGVAVDRRAGAAAARLLPGERRRRRVRRDAGRAGRDVDQPVARSWPSPTPISATRSITRTTTTTTWRRIRRPPRARGCCSSAPGSRRPTSTSPRSTRTSARWCSSCWRRTASAAPVRRGTSSRRATSTSTARSHQHPRRAAGRGVHPRDQQHPGRRPAGPRHRRQPGADVEHCLVSSLNSGLVLGRP